MLEQIVCREQILPAGPLRSIQSGFPIPVPLSAISRMVSLICPDLRLPLTAILANAEFLTQSDISEMERNEFYQEIRWAIDRMNELVTSLFEYSKDGASHRPAAQNIVDTVERMIRMTSVRQEFRRVTISRLGIVQLSFHVSLGKLAPGEYQCQVSVLDPAGHRAAFLASPDYAGALTHRATCARVPR